MGSSKIFRVLALGLAGTAISAVVSAGETINMTGRIYADRAVSLMPLANGKGVLGIEVAGVSAMSGEPPVLYAVTCSGLGIVDAEGKATSDVYCTFNENDSNAFDLKGTVVEGDGKLDVIGGSGRFAGATGNATFKRASEKEEPGTGIISVNIKIK